VEGPRLYRVHQSFDAPTVRDVGGAAREETARLIEEASLIPGSRVGITAGSRGVKNAIEAYRGAAKALREAGCEPFLFSAMGSHGRGTAEGQRDLLRSLGVTEEKVGAPVVCSDEVVQLGETESPVAGLPVYAAKEAVEADGVVVINRVKPHTSYHGPYESGLMKMLAVGMGRAPGATMVHRLGWKAMPGAVESIGGAVLERLGVVGGLALVENAREETALVEGLPPQGIPADETRLLEKAREYMPSLPVRGIDLCVVMQMGKNYSGTGMDPNIVGRMQPYEAPGPNDPLIRYLAVLDLSGESHGNATGVGLADFTTERLVSKMDREATYLNCLTSGGVARAAIPMTLADDEALFEAAWKALKPESGEEVRMVVVENTLHLGELWVSEALLGEAEERGAEVAEGPLPLAFESGRLAL